jgi:hypothetical protein
MATLFGLAFARRSLHRHDLVKIQEVASYLFAVVGTLYAVILGLIVVDSMSKFSEARLTVAAEANALSDIVLFASQLDGDAPRRVRALAEAYVKTVTDREWSLMSAGQSSPEAKKLAVDLSVAILSFEPKTEREQEIFAAQMEAGTQFWNNRRLRVVTAAHSGLPLLEWIVLIVGGVITVVFTYFFQLDDFRLQLMITGMLAAVIALNLYLILMFASPFSGDVKVHPEGFDASRYIIEEAREK